LPAEQVPLAYAESALAVQMLIERGGIPALTALLQDLAEGQEFTQSFERRVFLSYQKFLTLWEQQVRE
jgi:hypothetical protein